MGPRGSEVVSSTPREENAPADEHLQTLASRDEAIRYRKALCYPRSVIGSVATGL